MSAACNPGTSTDLDSAAICWNAGNERSDRGSPLPRYTCLSFSSTARLIGSTLALG